MKKSNNLIYYLLAIVITMLGLSYISVPLYQIFCQTYGLGGIIQKTNVESNQMETLSSLPSPFSLKSNEEQLYQNKLTDDQQTESIKGKVIEIYEQVSDQGEHKIPHSFNYAGWNQPISINFCAEIANDLPWELKPTISKMIVYPGDTALTFYLAHNLSNDAITGVATYNVLPAKAGIYFNKIQCFCFEEQRLKGNEYVELPILFFIDTEFLTDPKMKDIDTITLYYTFFKT